MYLILQINAAQLSARLKCNVHYVLMRLLYLASSKHTSNFPPYMDSPPLPVPDKSKQRGQQLVGSKLGKNHNRAEGVIAGETSHTCGVSCLHHEVLNDPVHLKTRKDVSARR